MSATITEALLAARRRLTVAGVDTPDLDARLLLAHVLCVERISLVTRAAERMTPDQAARFNACLAQRAQFEPVSRIIGERWFYGRRFAISPATLDPRPETETLIETALTLLDEAGVVRTAPLRILDLGTGTGCILLTLLAELPGAHGIGVDISEDALTVARRNATELGLEVRAAWQQGSWLTLVDGVFDLIVSNPPYIPAADMAGLDRDVIDYDPRAALVGGADGLDAYRAICGGLFSYIPTGYAVFEVGAGQADAVADLLRNASKCGADREIRIVPDLGGIARCVAAGPRRRHGQEP